MMTTSNGNIFRVTGPLCGEFTGHQWIPHTEASDAELWCFYASAFWRRRHYVFGLSVRPSEAWNTPPTVTALRRWHVSPSVRPERFPDICRRTHGGNGLKFYMLVYLDHLQNWLDYGHSLDFPLFDAATFTLWNGSNLGFPGISRRSGLLSGLWFAPEQTAEQTTETQTMVIWDAIVLIMTWL